MSGFKISSLAWINGVQIARAFARSNYETQSSLINSLVEGIEEFTEMFGTDDDRGDIGFHIYNLEPELNDNVIEFMREIVTQRDSKK